MKIKEMETQDRKTGIDAMGNVPWGTHFCLFYQTKEDLADILVPYFKSGLENNEFCVWVTSEPLRAEEVKSVFRKTVKNLDDYIKNGQIEILDYSDWYTKSGKFDSEKVLQGWVEKEKEALKRGFDGLRLTGNTFWFEKELWSEFADYERIINNIIGNHKMIVLCTYSLDKCRASEIVDVVANHQFTLTRKSGKWLCVENSEHKQAEEARKSLQEQLFRSEKLDAVGGLIAGVVHEINNPLTGIKGLSELLMNETLDEEKKKDLKFIHQSSERIEKIVKNLQRFAHREKPTRTNVNINELIDVVISIRNYEMEARNIKVEKDYQPDLPPVFADPSQLEQVFLSLILNAEDAIHDNQEKAGTLFIATSTGREHADGKTVVVEFSDTGPGIPIDVLPKLFNPFFTTKPVGKGTGLGLSVSYGIIKEHGGEISAGNRKEGGAVFTIELPVRGVV